MSLPFRRKASIVAVMQHTLQRVRTAGRTIEFVVMPLGQRSRAEMLEDWSEAGPVGDVAIAPNGLVALGGG